MPSSLAWLLLIAALLVIWLIWLFFSRRRAEGRDLSGSADATPYTRPMAPTEAPGQVPG